MKTFKPLTYSLIGLALTIALTLPQQTVLAGKPANTGKPGSNPPIPNSVCLDAGHGGTEPGTSNGGIVEKDLNLEVANRLDTLLQANGYTVFRTRTADVALSGSQRAEICNNSRAAILVSIHHNGSTDSNVNYSLGVFHGNDDKALAQTLVNTTSSALQLPNGGLYQLANKMLFQSKMPATISEAYFLTSDTELAKLNDPTRDYRQEEAAALYQGIVNYFNSQQ